MDRDDVPNGLLDLLHRLKAYVVDWNHTWEVDEEKYDESKKENPDLAVSDIDHANVVSSELDPAKQDPADPPLPSGKRHIVALDIDYPAYVVPSSTPGHYHLYLDVPGGIEQWRWESFIKGCTVAGIVEHGYGHVSLSRGHTNLRLPWVSKAEGDTPKKEPEDLPKALEPDPWSDPWGVESVKPTSAAELKVTSPLADAQVKVAWKAGKTGTFSNGDTISFTPGHITFLED
jgi:hypothetical protein